MIDRRRFLKRLTVASTAAALGVRPSRAEAGRLMSVETVSGLTIKETLQPEPQTDYDVLIAGAGVSGLYSAWRIARDWSRSPLLSEWAAARPDNRLRIAIVEWGDRIGGRIDTRIIAGMRNVPAELGGMRFTADHKLVWVVVKHFNLPTESFPMSKNRQFYLRGRRFDEKAIEKGYRVPYALARRERRMTPDQVTNLAIQRICNCKLSDAKWQWIKENFRYSDPVYHHVPLYDIGFWNILYRVLSNEGYDYVWDGGGYNSNTINWNAAEALPYMLSDFSSPTDFFRIKTGFHCLPIALKDDLERLGVPIKGGTRLTSFEKRGDYIEARVEARVNGVPDTAKAATFRTRALMLAMPQRSLQLIDQQCEFFQNESVQKLIQSVLPQPSYKLFLAYERRWWSKRAFCPGPTITDLPLRITYDFGSEEERDGSPGDSRTLLLASYSDMQAQTFWNVLERDDLFKEPPSRAPIAQEAPATMQRMAEDQLVKSLRIRGAPPPRPTAVIGAYCADWSRDPYGAGYHAWAPHFKAWEVMGEIRRPRRDWHVYICGEAYSNAQAWVEGAFCTAESVLEEFLRLPRIQGLDEHYPLLASKPLEPGTSEAYPTFLAVRTPKLVF